MPRSIPSLFTEAPPAACAWYRRVWALFALALFAATWRLWTPQQVFPQVPLFSFATQAPGWLDWTFFAGILLSLAAGLAAPASSRWRDAALLIFATSTIGAIVLDQHRLQPWAYQFVLIAVVLARRYAPRSLALLRCLTIGIYLWSSLGKFDYVFLHGLGQQFLATLAGFIGVKSAAWPAAWRLAAAAMFPASELLVGAGLCFQRTRAAALAATIVMHLGLIAVLGPWGLGHQPAVLIWNGFFLLQNVLLFGPLPGWSGAGAREPSELASPPISRRWGAAEVLTLLAVVLPVLEPWRLWDHWPAWGLYSTRSEKVVVLVRENAAARLPVELQPFLRESDEESDWLRLEIDRWSLAAVRAPLYPQARFQLGAAVAISEQYALGNDIRAFHGFPADRWTGERREEIYDGTAAIAQAANSFWLNGLPRRSGQTAVGTGNLSP